MHERCDNLGSTRDLKDLAVAKERWSLPVEHSAGAHGEVRHGVFLQPEAQTSAAVTTITTYLRAQYGIVSAGRFPPHVTLAGSLPLAVSEIDLLTAVVAAARRTNRFR